MENNFQTPSPMIKGEDLPEHDNMGLVPFSAESTPDVVDPLALLSTPSHQDDFSVADLASPSPEDHTTETTDGKKPTKKRKSWGQVLPEPKTNLPPRKRAKTEDEKEQRRVERVLRNRRAAQSSRERKRQETEALARRNKELEEALIALTQRNARLEQELKKAKPELGGISSSSDAVTLSQPLFIPTAPENGAANEVAQMSQSTLDLLNGLLNNSNRETPKTVNPASISPVLSPVAEELDPEPPVEEPKPETPRAAQAAPQNVDEPTTRSTQYSAAVLCDLQCQRPVEISSLSGMSTMWQPLSLALHFSATFLAYLTLATSLRRQQTYWISIINLVTRTSPSSSSLTPPPGTTTTAQPPTSSSSKKTLRLKLLRKFLTCNRQLARPLQDATLEVLRLKLTRGDSPEVLARGAADVSVAASSYEQAWATNNLPSKERLMSLLLAIRLLERRIQESGTPPVAVGDCDLLHDKIARSKRRWVSIGEMDGVIADRSCRQQRVDTENEPSVDEEFPNEVAT